MSAFLLMIAETNSPRDAADRAEAFAAHARFAAELGPALLDAGLLHPSSEGKRARLHDDKIVIEDGPFDAAMSRYYLLRAEDLDAAVRAAATCPIADGDILDVRTLEKGHVPPGKLDRPGKVFAFLVLAVAPDEPTWDQIMKRIDDDTKDKFPAEVMRGGMKLESPRAGRRIVIDKSKRRLLDGPFLESKEIIGGLFFASMPSMDDAVKWASSTAFAIHGALEIRELWRI
jgi:hypothetical protein